MAEPNVKTWLCERDDRDAAAPYCATLLIDNRPIASGRGGNELAAFAQLVEVLDGQGIVEGPVLGMHGLMREWRKTTAAPPPSRRTFP